MAGPAVVCGSVRAWPEHRRSSPANLQHARASLLASILTRLGTRAWAPRGVAEVEKAEEEQAGSVSASAQDGAEATIQDQLADLRRDVAELVRRETQLVTTSRRPQLRRLTVDVLGPVAIALTLLTAFGLANAALVLALSAVLPAWAAALILAVGWAVVGALLVFVVWRRAEHGKGVAWWRLWTGGGDGTLDETRAARDRAAQAVRERLEHLAPALSDQAIAAIVPIAMGAAARMATEVTGELEHDVAGEVEGVGRELVDESEEIVERIDEAVPGARVINQIWDVVLLPGRTGIRLVTTVLRRPSSED